MRLGPLLVIMTATVLLSSGCLEGTGGPKAPAPAAAASTTPETGGIEGSVVDEEHVPVPNATVSVVGANHSTMTGPDGRFALSQMAPAPYVLVVRADGFKDKNHGAEVLAGEVAKATIILERKTILVAYLDSGYTFVGYFNAAVAVVAGSTIYNTTGSSGTLVPDLVRTKNQDNIPLGNGWFTVLMEIQWEPGSLLADQMRLRLDLPKGSGATYAYNHFVFPTFGKSPLKYRMDDKDYTAFRQAAPTVKPMEHAFGALYYMLLPYASSAAPAGVMANQRFTVYGTVAYNEHLTQDYTRLPA